MSDLTRRFEEEHRRRDRWISEHSWDAIPLPKAKPCPFCGGEPEGEVTNVHAWWVSCADCDAEGPSGARPDVALSAWNQRQS